MIGQHPQSTDLLSVTLRVQRLFVYFTVRLSLNLSERSAFVYYSGTNPQTHLYLLRGLRTAGFRFSVHHSGDERTYITQFINC
jgi:hypothetical protein